MKKLSTVLLLLLLSTTAFAGDVANFINLGFSPNGNYFMFGEYGVVTDSQTAYSNMWLVDVKNNSFVRGGVYSGEYTTVVEPGESSLGGLFKLLGQSQDKIKSYKIDHLEQGRPLYIRINDNDDVNVLDFRDFVSGTRYNFQLEKNVRMVGEVPYSSFSIKLKTTDKAGKVKNFNLGNPSYERKGVSDYKIERILHTSTGENIVVVLSKFLKDDEDTNVRYMVETISLK